MSRTGSAGMDGLKRKKKKTAREGTPEPKKVKEHSQLQAKEHTQQQGEELELLVNKHSAIEKIVEIPSQSSAETVTVPQVQFLI